MDRGPGSITSAVNRLAAGEQPTREEVFELVYDELRRRAAAKLKGDQVAALVAPTEIVHTLYERLFRTKGATWEDRRHFFGCAARVMEQVMIDAARRSLAGRRAFAAAADHLRAGGGGAADQVDPEHFENAVAALEQQDSQAAEIFRLRLFAGLTAGECALATGLSERTVFRDWRLACAYVAERIERGGTSREPVRGS